MSRLRRFLLRFVTGLRGARAEDQLGREMEAHLQLLEDDFRARGLSAGDARAAARRAFGGVEQVKERQRDARSFRILDNTRLDFRLGARMLVRHRGLALVGGFGMAVAIAVAVAAFAIVSGLLDPHVPLPDGDRLVALRNWNPGPRRVDARAAADLEHWRAMRSLRDVGAYRSVTRNLIVPGMVPETVRVAEMSAAGFRAAGIAPLMGRHLVDSDERAGAPAVVVIGHDLWRDRFASDPAIVGRRLRLGAVEHEVVGVMPEKFEFPVFDNVWVPLAIDSARYERGQGPEINVFGRLAPGATLAGAGAEIALASGRDQSSSRRLDRRPQVLPYTYSFSDMDDPENAIALRVVQLVVVLLFAVVSVNVAILVYARTAMRQGEIAMRSALGAGRRRIVAQLFIEALVLSAAAAVAGLSIAGIALEQIDAAVKQLFGRLPFWLNFSLSLDAVAVTVLLTLAAAAIVGVVPALKATGRGVQYNLQTLSAGAGAGMQMGRLWTLLIVAQVAFAVAFLPPAIYHAADAIREGTASPGFAAEDFMTATLVLDGTTLVRTGSSLDPAAAARYDAARARLAERLEAERDVAAVTFSAHMPGDEPTVWIEIEGISAPSAAQAEASGFAVRTGTFGHEVRVNRVDPDFFAAFAVPILTGRGFSAADLTRAASAAPSVVVNRSFVEGLVGGASPLGRRIRYVGLSGDARDAVELGPWYEVIGVVNDFPAGRTQSGVVAAKVYHAAAAGELYPAALAIHLRGTPPATFAARLREVSAEVDPELQLRIVSGMDEALSRQQGMMRVIAASVTLLTASVVLLSAAGIYAMMSFIVSRRRKEIGIRAALGANPRRILWSVFSRALMQLALGALVGAAASLLVDRATHGELMQGHGGVVLPLVAVFMMAVGFLAALGPARRGLRIDPTEALRDQ